MVLMDVRNSNIWSSFVDQAINQYNDEKHSTIQMSPKDAWNQCYRPPSQVEIVQEKLDRLATVKLLQKRTLQRGLRNCRAFI
jgi:hypothetical protein